MTNTAWVARTFLMKRKRGLMALGPQNQVSEYLLIRTTGRVKRSAAEYADDSVMTFEDDKIRAREACLAHDVKLYTDDPGLFRHYPSADDYELMVHDRGWPTITRVECSDHPLTPKDFKP